MKSKARDKQIVEHIIKHCDEIKMAMDMFGASKDVFLNNPVFLNSCSMSLLQIGELARKLSDEFIGETSDIPWKQIKGMRNYFAHDYENMKKDMIWNTIIEDVPVLRQKCKKLLD